MEIPTLVKQINDLPVLHDHPVNPNVNINRHPEDLNENNEIGRPQKTKVDYRPTNRLGNENDLSASFVDGNRMDEGGYPQQSWAQFHGGTGSMPWSKVNLVSNYPLVRL